MLIFPILNSFLCTNPEAITYEGLRNVLSGFNNNYLKYVADSEERTLKYINNVLEEKSKQENERHLKLLQTIGEILKNNENKEAKNDSLLKILPFLKGQKNDEALISLLSSKKGDNLPILLHLLSKKGNNQLPNNLLLPLLTNSGGEGDSDKFLMNYLIYQKLTEQQEQGNQSNCPPLNTLRSDLYGPSTSNQYGPALNPVSFVQPTASYGPAANNVTREAPPCPQFQDSCPNQGIENREYGRNYGKRP